MRLKRTDFVKARRIDALLPLLLPTLRTIPSAQQELNWIRRELPATKVRSACIRRGIYSEPLQYVIGSQPFGPLEIKCKPGVLIPRWETEEWCMELGSRIGAVQWPRPLTIADFCTGTGCIPLALSAVTKQQGHRLFGIDISDSALSLFRTNIAHNRSLLGQGMVNPIKADILSISAKELQAKISAIGAGTISVDGSVDVITANPPYVTQPEYAHAERSVRLYEPKLALLGDLEFYTAILQLAANLKTRAVVFEVGTMAQVDHVKSLGTQLGFVNHHQCTDSSGRIRKVEVWTEWAAAPDRSDAGSDAEDR